MISKMEVAVDEDKRSLSGYGIVFNSDSHPYETTDENGEPVKVFEQIRSASLVGVSFDDVIVSFNHNEEKMLGRGSANTAFFEVDEKGVSYSVPDLPNTSYANDLIEMQSRGEINGSSFWFIPDWSAGWEFEKRTDGNYTSYPKKIERVIEMGPVVRPAYPETSAEMRSAFEKFIDQNKPQPELLPDGFENQQRNFKALMGV